MKTFLLYPTNAHTLACVPAILQARSLAGAAEITESKIGPVWLFTECGPDKYPGYRITCRNGEHWLLLPLPELQPSTTSASA